MKFFLIISYILSLNLYSIQSKASSKPTEISAFNKKEFINIVEKTDLKIHDLKIIDNSFGVIIKELKVLSKFDSLNALEIITYSGDYNTKDILFIKDLVNLKRFELYGTLKLDDMKKLNILPKLPHIVELSVFNINADMKNLIRFLDKFPNLQKVSIGEHLLVNKSLLDIFAKKKIKLGIYEMKSGSYKDTSIKELKKK